MKLAFVITAIASVAAMSPAQSAQPARSSQAEIVRVYGPGGPAPAMKEAAAAFSQQTGSTVEVVAGPTGEWIEKARKDADLVFSGSEHMMSDFIKAMAGEVDEKSVRPLYLRPSAILVRRGNPKRIGGLRDLLKPGHRVLVVHGAGQVGLWEDLVGQIGDIDAVRKLRSNIVAFAATSAEAQSVWTARPDIDAWIVWNVWGVNDRTAGDLVPVEADLRIYRDTGLAFTRRGSGDRKARAFADFLESSAGKAIFARHGWIERAPQEPHD